MEKPDKPLEIFVPFLLMDYIRLITIANCILSENMENVTEFKITPENYAKLLTEPIQAPLMGMILKYDNGVLKVQADAGVNQLYTNKIMREVALQYKENYGNRYVNYVEELTN